MVFRASKDLFTKKGFTMKGMAIAFETIIYLILAVMVLTVLLFFFTSQASPAQNEFQLLSDQREGCVAYAQQLPSCGSEVFPLASKLRKACDGLKQFNSCKAGIADDVCFKECCRSYCRIV